MKKFSIAALTALGLSATAAQAATFTVDYQEPGNPFGSEGLYTGVAIESEVYNGTFNAGGFNLTSEPMGDFLAFCIEVTQGLRDGATYENVSSPFTEAVLDNIEGLFNSAFDRVTDNVSSAGFQVALWEIVEDTALGLDLRSGSFSAFDPIDGEGSVIEAAQGFLDGIATAPTGLFEIDYLLSAASQDVVTATRVDAPSVVPVPASGLLLLSSLGVFMMRRKNA